MLEIIKQFVRRMLMGKGKGILQIAPKKDVNKFAKELLKKFKENGIPDSAVKNPNDVKVIWNQITNRESQILSTTLDDLLKGPVVSEGPKGPRVWDFSKKGEVHPFQGFTPKIVPKDKTLLRDSPERIAKIKAENKAAAERLRKKKLDEEPDDLASGGIARVA